MEKNVLKEYVRVLFDLNTIATSDNSSSLEYKRLNYYIITLLNNKEIDMDYLISGILEFKFLMKHYSVASRAHLISRVIEQEIKNTLLYIPNISYNISPDKFKNVKNVAFHEPAILKSQWYKNFTNYNRSTGILTSENIIRLTQTFMLLEQVASESHVAKTAKRRAKMVSESVVKYLHSKDYAGYHSYKYETLAKYKAAMITLFGGIEKFKLLNKIACREIKCDDANKILVNEAINIYRSFKSYINYCSNNMNNQIQGDYSTHTFKQLVDSQYKFSPMDDGAMTMGAVVNRFDEYLNNELINGLHLVQTDVRIPSYTYTTANNDHNNNEERDTTRTGSGGVFEEDAGASFDDFGGTE